MSKVLISGNKTKKLGVSLGGEEIGSGLNLFETFMLLAGLCKNKAHSVQVEIDEPENPGLAEFYRKGLDPKQAIAREREASRIRAVHEIEQLEQSIKRATSQVVKNRADLRAYRATLKSLTGQLPKTRARR
ncbi:MAG: hypothetical protein Q7S43_04760 [bacterium]|nr:hypothetical protein [bacterium]